MTDGTDPFLSGTDRKRRYQDGMRTALDLDRAVVVHGPADVRTALTAAVESGGRVALISAPDGAAYGGGAWFAALAAAAARQMPAVTISTILDCGDQPGHVLSAFRAGVRTVVFTGNRSTAEKLADIARQYGATVLSDRPPALDLRGCTDRLAVCRAWLSGTAVVTNIAHAT